MKIGELQPIRWDGRRRELVLLDQRLIPEKTAYVRCKNYRQVALAIKNMTVRGAPAIGVAAAYGIALAALKSGAKNKQALLKELKNASETLSKTRPTAVNLFWALERMMNVAEKFDGDLDDLRKLLVSEAGNILQEDVKVNRQIGRFGADLIPDGARVLTHCN